MSSGRRKTLGVVTNTRLSFAAAPARKASRASMGVAVHGRSSMGPVHGAGAAPGTRRRRSSVRGSLGGRAAVSEDPRPIRQKKFIAEESRRLMDALMTGVLGPYPYPVHDMERKGGPTGRQFKEMVVFLIQQIDPTFRIETAIDKDIPEVFKCLGYPYAISKNSLHAVGSPHTWPQLLVALTWLLDLALLTHANADAKESDPESASRRLLSDHTRRSYGAFLQADDDREEEYLIADKAVYQEQVDHQEGEIAAAKDTVASMRETLEELSNAKARLAEMKDINDRYRADLEKMEHFVAEQERYQKTMTAKLADTKAQKDTTDREIVEAREFVVELEHRREAQELSAADVQRMRQDGELLKEGIRAAREAHEQAQAQLHVLDRDYQRALAEVKDAVMVYNDDVAPVSKTKDSDSGGVVAAKAKLPLQVTFQASDATPRVTNPAGEGPKEVKAAMKALEKAFHTESLETVMKAQTLEAKVEAGDEGRVDKDKANKMLEQQLAQLEEALAAERATLDTDMESAGTEMEALQARTEAMRASLAELMEASRAVQTSELNKLAADVKTEETMLARERGKLHASIVAAMSKLTRHVSHVQGTISSGAEDLAALAAKLPTV